MKTCIALIALVALLPAQAAAADWTSSAAAGDIHFTAYWNGAPITGQFPEFQLAATLDPGAPTGGKLSLSIATAKVKMSSADITQAIRGEDWFDVKQYSEATFVSTAIARQADGSLQLQGMLRIKGHEKTLAFPIELVEKDGKLRLSGKLRLNRGDFAIGAGQWASGDLVAHRVDVVFSFALVPGH